MREVAGESLLVPLGGQVGIMKGVVVLNAAGHYLWNLLAQEQSLDDLACGVAQRFDVDWERARADVQRFVGEIAGMGLLQQ